MGTWHKITIKTVAGDVTIDALIVAPGLAVDGWGRRNLSGDSRWIITHIPSGLIVLGAFRLRREAIAMALRLADLTDWSAFTEQSIPAGLGEKVGELVGAKTNQGAW
jgi:hypothetical protein